MSGVPPASPSRPEQHDEPIPEMPHTTAFHQQALNCFMPVHSAPWVLGGLFLVAIVFLPIGVAAVAAADKVEDKQYRYDDAKLCTASRHESALRIPFNGAVHSQGCRARVLITLEKKIEAPIYFYYRIVGMYQNYRPFAKSRTDGQLAAEEEPYKTCKPFRYPGDYSRREVPSGTPNPTVNGRSVAYDDMYYNPCGAFAWSMFNDSFTIWKVDQTLPVPTQGAIPGATLICNGTDFDAKGNRLTMNEVQNPCTKKDIALSIDVDSRHKAVDFTTSDVQWSRDHPYTTDEPFLQQGYYYREAGHRLPDPLDEDFMVWMRVSGMPDFRKLYRKINVDLEPGRYVLDILELYDTTTFSGKKYVVLATTGWLGSRNYVLGIAYIVVGAFSFVLALALLGRSLLLGNASI